MFLPCLLALFLTQATTADHSCLFELNTTDSRFTAYPQSVLKCPAQWPCIKVMKNDSHGYFMFRGCSKSGCRGKKNRCKRDRSYGLASHPDIALDAMVCCCEGKDCNLGCAFGRNDFECDKERITTSTSTTTTSTTPTTTTTRKPRRRTSRRRRTTTTKSPTTTTAKVAASTKVQKLQEANIGGLAAQMKFSIYSCSVFATILYAMRS